MMRERARRIVPYVLMVALLACVAMGRALVESARDSATGDAAVARGDIPEAVRMYRRAAHWYVPGSPWCAHAYDRLETIASQAESQGRSDHAFSAWRAIRASALATRWVFIPERARLDRANRHLAALMVEMPQSPEDRGRDRARLREEHLQLLTEDHAPEPAWLLVMGVGFALWLLGAIWAALRGWNEDDRVQPRALGIAGAMVAFGLALFVLGIVRA